MQLAGIRYHQGRIAEAVEMRGESVELSQTGGSRVDWGFAVMRYGWLVALTRSIDEGLRLCESSIPPIEEASENWELASALYTAARLHLLRGSLAEAVSYGERALALSQAMQETGSRPEIERGLAQALLELDEVDGAASHAEAGVQVVAADDWASVGSTTMVLGLVRARQGRSREAESLLRKAIGLTESTDYVAERWEYYLSLAEFLLSTGRSKEAEPWVAKLREIIALYGEASPLAAYVERQLAATVPSSK